MIPDGYKDKPYLKGIDSQDKLFAMLDGSQNLLGKRPAGIPAADAPQVEWDKFYETMRPKTPAEYTFELDPTVKVDEKMVGRTKEIMHKYGLSAVQAKGIQKDFDAMAIEIAKEKGIQLQQQDTDFDKLATQVFGAEREQAIARGKQMLDQFVPAALKGEVAKLSNESLMVLAGVLNGVHAKYIKTDGAPITPPGGTAETPDTLRARARELMVQQGKLNPIDPNYDLLQKQINEIYSRTGGVK